MGQTGGFAQNPGTGTLVQGMADGGLAGAPGKQTLVGQPAVATAPQAAAPQAEAAAGPAEKEPDWSVRARAFNREHAALGEQFLQATGSACVGPDGELDPAEIARWQVAHGLKLRVYDAAVARLGDKIYGGVPREDLVATENGKQIRRDVSGPLQSLLSAMRADLAAGKPAGDKEVGKATGIHVTSAYRSPETDRDLWDKYFQGYLHKTTAERAATGDPFGAEAVKLLVRYIASRKAPPGGSNHSNGTAVDLTIEEGGASIKNSYDNQTAWKKSWQYAWLTANAATFGFKNYPKEAWHWDYKG